MELMSREQLTIIVYIYLLDLIRYYLANITST